ncbi:non-ribosomal peptide synthetase [Bacillus cereus]|uniref:non-ribosomal peptide synthetase n=1 Tax=Bacillus cereus TaxID=1396 RepID=UPI001E4CE951|nr:amino acid adenylation domain-containing protein [Bacillus cereus]MCU5475455.1 non-ribosomal peptide synthetase [Bacillus cereus]MCU5614890.1 non-ribosomal peptide synthetase [Bacillus cereus]
MGETQSYELSHGQKRFWVQSQLEPEGVNFNQPVAVQINQIVDMKYLQFALNNIIQRHFILRTLFKNINGEPRQVILENLTVEVPLIDLSMLNHEEKLSELDRKMRLETNKPFDLEKGPLLRTCVFKLANDVYIFYICMHHIIEDGWSIDLFFRELFLSYHAYSRGTLPDLPNLPIQYIDYANWQNQLVNSGRLGNQEKYWKEKLSGELPNLNLPTDFSRPKTRNHSVAVEKIVLEKDICKRLKQMNKEYGTTMFMNMVANLNILLSKISNQDDIIIGTPIAGRGNKHVKNLIGFFVNSLVLRNKNSSESKFSDFLADVKKTCTEAYSNQDYPFDQLLQVLNQPRVLNRAPLFDVLINFASENVGEIDFGGMKFEKLQIGDGEESNEFDITVIVEIVDEEMIISLNFQTDLFTKDTMKRIAENFYNIISRVSQDPEQKIKDINYLSGDELEVINEMNNTTKVYPTQVTIPSLISEQVTQKADTVCIIQDGTKITFKNLHKQSNKMGNLLRDLKVQSNELVSIIADRGIPLLSAILGIFKAGGAYVPIDPDYPEKRIEYMLKDSSCRVLIIDSCRIKELESYFPDSVEIIICLDTTDYKLNSLTVLSRKEGEKGKYERKIEKEALSQEDLEINVNEEDIAYVIYTSGSTGNPKGVMISHKAVLNTLFWLQDTFPLEEADVVAQKTSASFTDSVWEFFWPLLTGARLSILSTDIVKDPLKLYHSLKEEKVTVTQFVPALMNIFISTVKSLGGERHLPNLKWVFNGGEALQVNLVQEWYSILPNTRIANIYGMTESAIYATNYVIEDKPSVEQLSIPLGHPISNTYVYVLDQSGRITGFNVQGEICIGGTGITSGYWNKPDLTQQAFIQHPTTGEMLYRTGDLGCLRPDGILEYLGRIDDQVQVRGFRVEMKEVERAMVNDPLIQEAAVISHKETSGVTSLIGYYTVESEEVNPERIRTHLKSLVPEYMIPSYLIQLDRFPLTPHGKIDRKNLPNLERTNVVTTEYIPPGDHIERELVAIWEEVLEVDKIGIIDNFFSLGGQSLKIAKVMYRIQESLGVNVIFREFFEYQTIQEISGLIKSKSSNPYTKIEPLHDQLNYPVSSAQRRFYVLHKLEGDSMGNHISSAWILDGEIDYKQIEDIFKRLIQRHEILRTSFNLINGEIFQSVYPPGNWGIEYEEGKEDIESIFKSFIRPFDFEKPPLIRVKLIRLNEKKHALLIDVHHIVFDGISSTILMDDFISMYEGKTIEDQQVQYKDFASWQNNLFSEDMLKEQESFWLNEFDVNLTGKEIPILNLPTDYSRTKRKTFSGDSIEFKLTKDYTARLKHLAHNSGATHFMILFAAYSVFLSRYSGQEDIIIGTPSSGRHHIQVEKMIGMFVNTLAIRSYPTYEKTFSQFLNEVRGKTLEVLQNQEFPFDQLVNTLNLERDLSRNPLFDTMFRFQNFMDGEKEVSGLQVEPYPAVNGFTPFDLMLTITEMDGELHCTFDYSSELFQKATVQQMSKNFTELVSNLLTKPDQPLYTLNILTEEEATKLLVARNDTNLDVSKDKLVHQMFEEQATKTPHSIAVECGGRSLSYSELDKRSNSLARVLRNKGVRANKVVGLLINRSVDLITSMIAVLKAGGAYLPIDPDYPINRIKYILNESDAHILLTEDDLILSDFHFNGEVLDLSSSVLYQECGDRLDPVQTKDDIAYMIFTSGSTGNPKGVMISQKSVVNFIYGVTEKIPFKSGQTLLSVTTAAFDIFVLETLLPLTKGLRVALTTAEEQKDLGLFLNAVRRYQAEMLQITPSRLQLLFSIPEVEECFEQLEVLMVGGESFSENLLRQTKEITQSRIFNMYGPTETTVWSTIQELTYQDRITVGTPIVNTQVYILDRHLNPVPDNVVGDLWIGGQGVSLGYYKQPELTNEKFVKNPYLRGETIFNTGDLARWLPSGEIEVLGRKDFQIKIRGFRVEIGEIEKNLLTHSDIYEAVVNPINEGEQTLLCAYLIAHSDLTVKEIRQHLLLKLPDYMAPSHFVFLSEMPLTPNGKINRKELPSPDNSRSNLGVDYVSPATEMEIKISSIWQDVLKKDDLGVHDNFFDLGGNSVLLIQMNYRLNQSFNSQLTLTDCFAYPTISMLANVIEERLQDKHELSDIDKKRYKVQEDYWKEYLIKEQPFINLSDDMRAKEWRESYASQTLELPVRLINPLRHSIINQSYEVTDLLLTVLTNILSQLTQQKEVIVAVGEEWGELEKNKSKHNGIYPLRVNFGNGENFNQVCSRISKQRDWAEKTDLYPLPQLPDIVNKSREDVLLICTFINNTSLRRDIIKDYDLNFYLNIKEDKIRILTEYRATKINKNWIDKLMKGYIYVIEKICKSIIKGG